MLYTCCNYKNQLLLKSNLHNYDINIELASNLTSGGVCIVIKNDIAKWMIDRSPVTRRCYSQYHSFPHYKEGHELLALTMVVLLGHDVVIFKYQGLFAECKMVGASHLENIGISLH